MADLSRRGFVTTLAAAVPAASQLSRQRRSVVPIPSGPLNPETLLALGEAILPSGLGDDGVQRVLGAFQTWLKQYAAGAELLHGYGTGDIGYAPPNPADRWNTQLAELETAAQGRGVAFGELTDVQQTQILRGIVDDRDADRLPPPNRAEHVAVGLLAYFYATSEATDLCYRAAIAKNTCRPLTDAAKRPTPLPQNPGQGRVR